MADSNIYRRPAFINRPWITGKLYDQYASKLILHCDAYLYEVGQDNYLLIDWREGGKKQVALDCYLIEPDGLTPVWDAGRVASAGRFAYWTRANHGTMRRVHKRVLAQGPHMLTLGQGRWARVVTQAHYVHVAEIDPELGERNAYVDRKPYKNSTRVTAFPDIL